MNRREFLGKTAALGTGLSALASTAMHAAEASASKTEETPKAGKLTAPAKGSINVAILVSEGVNVIDFSGPWGVFESVMVPSAEGMPFRLFAVSDTADVVTSASGLKIKPHYTFEDVPEV